MPITNRSQRSAMPAIRSINDSDKSAVNKSIVNGFSLSTLTTQLTVEAINQSAARRVQLVLSGGRLRNRHDTACSIIRTPYHSINNNTIICRRITTTTNTFDGHYQDNYLRWACVGYNQEETLPLTVVNNKATVPISYSAYIFLSRFSLV